MIRNARILKPVVFLIVIAFCHRQDVVAQSLRAPENLKMTAVSVPEISQKRDSEKENPARRGEIVFLISLPFTAIMSFLLVNGVYYVSDPAYTFTMTKLPHEMIPFAIFSAVFSSSIIAWADYRTVRDKKKLLGDSGGSTDLAETRELQIGAALQTKF